MAHLLLIALFSLFLPSTLYAGITVGITDQSDPFEGTAVLILGGVDARGGLATDTDHPTDGGNGGRIVVKTGVEVNPGDGSDGDLIVGSHRLTSATYNYRRVSAYSLEIDGDVTINCQDQFDVGMLIGVFHPDAPPPRVRINAGHPTPNFFSLAPSSHIMTFVWMIPIGLNAPHEIVANKDGSGVDGGIVEFYTTHAGDVRITTVDVVGQPGENGGRGGNGGEVVVIATGGNVKEVFAVSADGGEGGSGDWGVFSDPSFNGGQGGDGGGILLSGQSIEVYAGPDAAAGFLRANGGHGERAGDGTTAHPIGFSGGAGGKGGVIVISGQLTGPGSFGEVSAKGGNGDSGGNGRWGPPGGPGYQGGAGGDGGAPGVLIGIAGDLSPGNGAGGGAGGTGGDGVSAVNIYTDPGGPGGNGGPGGVGGNAGGDGAQPGHGGSGGYGGQGGLGTPRGQNGNRGDDGRDGIIGHPPSVKPPDESSSHYLYVLTVGITHATEIRDKPGQYALLSGGVAALRVRDAFLGLPKLRMTAKALTLNVGAGLDNGDLIRREIDAAARRLGPGDTFILFVNAHGGFNSSGDEPPVDAGTLEDPRKYGTNAGDELLAISGNRNSLLTDDQLTAWFRGDVWDKVNKLFVIDACYSGGFWSSGPLDEGDLATLPKAAIIASAPESRVSHFLPPPDDLDGPGWGLLGQAVVGALDTLKDQSSITFDDLTREVYRVGEQSYNYYRAHNINGRILEIEDDWGAEVPVEWNPMVASTSDFDTALTPNTIVTPSVVLNLTKAGSGTGRVTGPGIDCGADCQEGYAAGTAVTLSASADPGSLFDGFGGDCNGAGQVTMDADKHCTATFTLAPATLPDLAGNWNSASQSCRKGTCTLKGSVRVVNQGTVSAPASRLRVVLSDDAVLDGSDLVVKESNLKQLKPGRATTSKIKIKLPPGVTAASKYLFAVLDALGSVAESDESNNTPMAGPVP